MDGDSFLNLVPVFSKTSERTIEGLGQLYDSPERLEALVKKAMEGFLVQESLEGRHILLKPNWVLHDRNKQDHLCLRTNNKLILALLSVLLPAKPLKITIGDAPIQGADWRKIATGNFQKQVESISIKYGVPVIVRDFRRVVFNAEKNQLLENQNPSSDYIIFDVGKNSFLEPITPKKKKTFRVSHYDYERLAEVHKKGVHKYCIAKELFEADVIISIPKVKTHQKAGITAALKNLVGVNGDKDYLPHHRIGGTKQGGDSYPGKNLIRRASERVMDLANKTIGRPPFRYLQKAAITLWNASSPGKFDQWGAAWYGNDTTWRMVLDLNLIVSFGKKDGTLAEKPQRTMYSLCDAIIGGQGNGPLLPDPLPLGLLSFSNNAALNDFVFAQLMGLEPENLALIKNAFEVYPKNENKIYLKGEETEMTALESFAIAAKPAPGWIR